MDHICPSRRYGIMRCVSGAPVGAFIYDPTYAAKFLFRDSSGSEIVLTDAPEDQQFAIICAIKRFYYDIVFQWLVLDSLFMTGTYSPLRVTFFSTENLSHTKADAIMVASGSGSSAVQISNISNQWIGVSMEWAIRADATAYTIRTDIDLCASDTVAVAMKMAEELIESCFSVDLTPSMPGADNYHSYTSMFRAETILREQIKRDPMFSRLPMISSTNGHAMYQSYRLRAYGESVEKLLDFVEKPYTRNLFFDARRQLAQRPPSQKRGARNYEPSVYEEISPRVKRSASQAVGMEAYASADPDVMDVYMELD